MDIIKINRDYKGLMLRIALKILVNHADAEDAIQDLLIKIPEKIEKYEKQDDVKFSSWLGTVTRNHCLDVLRKHKSKPIKMSVSSREVSDIATSTDLYKSIEYNDTVINYMQLLNVLLPRQREVVILWYKDFGYKGIEDELEVSEAYVKHHLHNARKIMRNAYKSKREGLFIT